MGFERKLARGDPNALARHRAMIPDESAIPAPPPDMSSAARSHWLRLTAFLARRKTITASDGDALGILCEAMVEYALARSHLETDGYTIDTDKGGKIPHPCVKIAADSWKRILLGLREFGLTPRSRNDVAPVGAIHDSEVEDKLRLLAAG